MSPAHLHQYVSSISPGNLSESLPSSQVKHLIKLSSSVKKQTANQICNSNQPKIQFNFHTHKQKYTRTPPHFYTNLHHTQKHTTRIKVESKHIQMKSYWSQKLHNAHVCISASIVLLCSVVSLPFSPLLFSFHFQFWVLSIWVVFRCWFDLFSSFFTNFSSNYHFCMPDCLCLSTLFSLVFNGLCYCSTNSFPWFCWFELKKVNKTKSTIFISFQNQWHDFEFTNFIL